MMFDKETVTMWRKMEFMALNMKKRGCWPGAKAFYSDLMGFESSQDYINFLDEEIGYFEWPIPAHCKRLCG